MNEKTTQKMVLALLLCMFVNLQTGKAQENKKVRKMVVGEWKLDDITVPGDSIENAAIRKMILEKKEISSFNFIKNGSYEITMTVYGSENTKKGVWRIDENGKTLITLDDKGIETEMMIDTLNKNRMVIREKNGILTLVK